MPRQNLFSGAPGAFAERHADIVGSLAKWQRVDAISFESTRLCPVTRCCYFILMRLIDGELTRFRLLFDLTMILSERLIMVTGGVVDGALLDL